MLPFVKRNVSTSCKFKKQSIKSSYPETGNFTGILKLYYSVRMSEDSRVCFNNSYTYQFHELERKGSQTTTVKVYHLLNRDSFIYTHTLEGPKFISDRGNVTIRVITY